MARSTNVDTIEIRCNPNLQMCIFGTLGLSLIIAGVVVLTQSGPQYEEWQGVVAETPFCRNDNGDSMYSITYNITTPEGEQFQDTSDACYPQPLPPVGADVTILYDPISKEIFDDINGSEEVDHGAYMAMVLVGIFFFVTAVLERVYPGSTRSLHGYGEDSTDGDEKGTYDVEANSNDKQHHASNNQKGTYDVEANPKDKQDTAPSKQNGSLGNDLITTQESIWHKNPLSLAAIKENPKLFGKLIALCVFAVGLIISFLTYEDDSPNNPSAEYLSGLAMTFIGLVVFSLLNCFTECTTAVSECMLKFCLLVFILLPVAAILSIESVDEQYHPVLIGGSLMPILSIVAWSCYDTKRRKGRGYCEQCCTSCVFSGAI